MQANPNDQMDTEYQNLTEKQRAVIDAHAKNPDATNREKARIAGVEILGQEDPVNESYASEILNKKFADLAEYRAEIKQNERPQGSMQTTGDPFSNIPDKEPGVQTIQDRPVKDAGPADGESQTVDQGQAHPKPTTQSTRVQSNPIQVLDTGDGIAIKLDYRYVQSLLESQDAMLPDDLHQQLVDVVVQRAFQ